jgi:hypothetical protein
MRRPLIVLALAVLGLAPRLASAQQQCFLCYTPPASAAGGSGTVTHTGGALTLDLPLLGAGADDIKSSTAANMKSVLSLGNVENTALSTWAGSANITTLGTIGTIGPVTVRTTFGSAADAANAVDLNETAGCITFEGATADAFEKRLCVSDPTVDVIATIPSTGTAAITLGALELSQTWTGSPSFSGTVGLTGSMRLFTGGSDPALAGLTANTPDVPAIETGTVSNSWEIIELADAAFDFNNGPCGTSACTDPTLIVHSHNQDTTQYQSIAFYGSSGKATKTLTESSATTVIRIPVASGAATGGKLIYTVFASDSTDHQIRTGTVSYAVVNKGGTETCAVNGVDGSFTANPAETQDGSGAGAMSTGTLTYAWSVDTAATNACDLKLNAVSSLTQTTLQIRYRVDNVGPGEPLPQ